VLPVDKVARKHYETVGFASCWDPKPDKSDFFCKTDSQEIAVQAFGPEMSAAPIGCR